MTNNNDRPAKEYLLDLTAIGGLVAYCLWLWAPINENWSYLFGYLFFFVILGLVIKRFDAYKKWQKQQEDRNADIKAKAKG